MIKLEHVVLASPEQMAFMIEGMRNIDYSWERSDSRIPECPGDCQNCPDGECQNSPDINFVLGTNDRSLMQCLSKAGVDHRKFLRMMPVYVRITAPLYWWNEFDTYKVGTVANSCSTMHKIQEKEFTLEDFSCEHLISGSMSLMKETIDALNDYREWYLKYDSIREEDKVHFGKEITCKKDIWWQMIQLLPSSYNETRNVKLDYAVLADIYKSKRYDNIDEWCTHETPEEHEFRNKDFSSCKWGFCDWIEQLPYAELICEDGALMTPNEQREKIGLEPIEEPSESLKMLKVGKAAADGIQKGINRPNPLTTEALIKLRMVEPWPWINKED